MFFFRDVKNSTFVLNLFEYILYGAAVYFFLADDDLQQREWIFVAV